MCPRLYEPGTGDVDIVACALTGKPAPLKPAAMRMNACMNCRQGVNGEYAEEAEPATPWPLMPVGVLGPKQPYWLPFGQ